MARSAVPTAWALRLALLLCSGLTARAWPPELGREGTCPPGDFQCRTGGFCVHLNWLCDSDPDCPDGSDEEACTAKPPCTQDGQCPPTAQPCPCKDPRDCQDGAQRVGHLYNCSRHPCPAGELNCPVNGECIPLTWVCDHHPDCLHGEDELGCGTEPLPEGSPPRWATAATPVDRASLANATATSAGDQDFVHLSSLPVFWWTAAGVVVFGGLVTISVLLLSRLRTQRRAGLPVHPKDCLGVLGRKATLLL